MIDLKKIGDIQLTPGLVYDDFILWLDILGKGFTAKGLNKDLMRYRVRSGSLSRNKIKSSLAVWNIYRKKLKLPYHQALFNFIFYAFNAIRKYKRF